MAKLKKDFINNKINKDVDKRLVQKNEYIHAQNVSIPMGDDTGTGSIEIILGNEQNYQTSVVSDLPLPANTEIVGYIVDQKKNRVYWFVTDFDGYTRGANVGAKFVAYNPAS